MVNNRLLIIDDDEKLCRLLRDYFVPHGYVVDTVHDGNEGLNRALNGSYAAVILDVMLPGMNGLDILRQLRRTTRVPVVMLSAIGDESDRIAGLEVGADDYLPKTFSTRELLARLRAVLRRAEPASEEDAASAISVGELRVEPEQRTVTLRGKSLNLTQIEFDILLSLARSPGRVKTREQLLAEVADRMATGNDRTIDVHVSALRKSLGDDPKVPQFIETIRGIGYRLRRPKTDV